MTIHPNPTSPGFGGISSNITIINFKEGRWWVGKGLDIPLNHPALYPSQNLHNPNLTTGTVANRINQKSCS